MNVLQRMKNAFKDYFIYSAQQREFLSLKNRDYSKIGLSNATQKASEIVQENAERIYGNRWNYYSNALNREVLETFEKSIEILRKDYRLIDYLEIGSCQGISMSAIGLILDLQHIRGKLVSIDPYFEQGYKEGSRSVLGKKMQLKIDKRTKNQAIKLYEMCGLDVEIKEMISLEALTALIGNKSKFHLIFIDGSHETLNPVLDFGLSCVSLYCGGIIMLDDHHWPDVKVIKSLCDEHCEKVHESWKIAAYRIKL